MHCIKCGEELSPTQAFCPFCGAMNQSPAKRSIPKKSASEYVSPTYEIFETDTVYENPNKAYDNKADEFYRPHNLPHSNRRGSRRHRRRRKHQNRFLRVALPIAAIALAFMGMYFALKISSAASPKVNIKGRWAVTSATDDSVGNVYLFANDGFVTVKKSVYESTQMGTRYCWKVEGDKLIVDDTTYHWSTDLNNYSSDEQEHWCVSGTTIYISNTSDDGYKILNKVLE